MAKLIPVFLVMAAFFLLALAVGLVYHHTQVQTAAAPGPVAQIITLANETASPTDAIINMGQSVAFAAKDNLEYDLWEVNADGSAMDNATKSGVITPEKPYHVTYARAGTFVYKDHLHQAIQIRIIVIDPSK